MDFWDFFMISFFFGLLKQDNKKNQKYKADLLMLCAKLHLRPTYFPIFFPIFKFKAFVKSF